MAALDVLIVDDHEPTRVVIARMLRAAGVEHIRDASDASQAAQMLTERSTDLVITDQIMPDTDGVSFIASLRANPAYAKTRTILITGYAEIDGQARAAGANAVLVKPIEASALLKAVKAALA